MQIICAILLTCVYLVLYILFGQAFLSIFKLKTKSLIFTILIGFFVYYSVFQLCALPLKIALAPLSLLSTLWSIVVIAVAVLTIIAAREELVSKIISFKSGIIHNKIPVLLIMLIIGIQLIVIETNWYPGSGWDSSFYLGEITSSLLTNTIEQYDAYTGQIQEYLNNSYLLENYEMHSAVVCQLFGLHPLLEVKTVMTAIVVLISNFIYFKISEELLGNKPYKIAVMMFFIAVINAFNVSIYSPSSFYFNRTYEGKTILGVIILPMVLYLFIKFIIDKKHNNVFIYLFIVNFAAFCLNMSSVYVLTVSTVILFVPAIIIKKRYKCIVSYLISMLPCFGVAILTYSLSNGWIIFEI